MEKESREVIKYRKEHPKLMEIPFNSRNKYQLSIHDMNDPMDDRYLAVMKGAPERIAGFCTHILIGNKTFEFDSRWKKEFNEVYTALGSLGERVFGKVLFYSTKFPIIVLQWIIYLILLCIFTI